MHAHACVLFIYLFIYLEEGGGGSVHTPISRLTACTCISGHFALTGFFTCAVSVHFRRDGPPSWHWTLLQRRMQTHTLASVLGEAYNLESARCVTVCCCCNKRFIVSRLLKLRLQSQNVKADLYRRRFGATTGCRCTGKALLPSTRAGMRLPCKL